MNTRNIMVDGLSVETTDQGAQAIEKLLGDRQKLQDQINQLAGNHSAALAAKDGELSALQAKLDDALSKVLDQAAIDKLVADRVALEATALKIAKDVKPTGLSDSALKLAVVKAKLGDKLPADRLNDQAYIDARFDILAEDAEKTQDTFRDTRRAAPPRPVNDAFSARDQAFAELLHYDQTGDELAN